MTSRAILVVLALLCVPTIAAQEFVERTSQLDTRVSPIIRPVSGGAMIDFNVDGLMDVYREGLLQVQRPDGRFENRRVPFGIDDLNGLTEGATWADYDGDGFPDLFLIDRSQSPKLYKNLGRWFFARSDRSTGLDQIPPIRSAVWFASNGDGRPDLAVTGNSGTQIYQATNAGGFQLRSDVRASPGCGLSAANHDGDGDQDLYVSACLEGQSVDLFLENLGVGVFAVDGDALPQTNGRRAVGAVHLDYDRDGDLDVFVANEVAEPPPQLETASDRLYRNDGNGRFSDVTNAAGVTGAIYDQAWGLAAADFDNDGWVDLYVANRFAADLSEAEHRLLHNNGDGTFSDVTGTSLPGVTFSARSAPIVGDLNADGQIDLYLTSEDGDRLFYNQGSENHWVRVRLRGLIQNSDGWNDGLGAEIRVWKGGTVQVGQITAGEAHASQHNGLVAHFGLAAASVADSIVVSWPNGDTDRVLAVAADQEIVVQQGGGSGRVPGTFALTGPEEGHRVDLSDGAIDFQWSALNDPTGTGVTYELTLAGPGVDTTFVAIPGTGFTLDPQFLIQHQTYFWTVVGRNALAARSATQRGSFSYGGSSVAAPIKLNLSLKALHSGQLAFGDYDHDGDLDIAMTGTGPDGGVSRLYTAVDALFPAGESDLSFKLFRDSEAILRNVRDSHVSWVDYDGDGDEDLFLAGYFEDVDGNVSVVSELYDMDGVLKQNPGVSVGFPDIHQGDGAWADFDADGDLDLLLAGATQMSFPWASVATIVRNDNGRFTTLDLGFIGVRFATVSWADYDGDGDPDAFVSGQTDEGRSGTWTYRNDGGSFSPVDLGLPGLQFGSMDWADFDQDGDPDLVISGGRLSPDLYSGATLIFRNDDGVLTDIGADRDLQQVVFGASRWLDFDLDGDQDLVVTGAESPFGERESVIYRNEDNVRFAEEFRLVGLLFSEVAVGDYNGDGDIDIAAIGQDEAGKPSVLFFLNLLRAEVIPAALIQR
ncbi:MAG: hypothetical protein ACI84D_002555 [Thalassolituus oleivorans]